MTTQPITIAQHRFAFGYYRQLWWNWLIGTAFFCGGIGASLFILSLLTQYRLGLLLGYLIVGILGGVGYDMGVIRAKSRGSG